MSGNVLSVLLVSDIDGSWSMYLIDEAEPSLVASESRLSHLFVFGDDLFAGMIILMEAVVFVLLEDREDTSTRDARVNGVWKQNMSIVPHVHTSEPFRPCLSQWQCFLCLKFCVTPGSCQCLPPE